MNRAFTNILSSNVNKAANFYQELLGMTRHFDSDWFVVLTHANIEGLEFGILSNESEIVPEIVRTSPQGVMVTFVVEDVAPIFEKAKSMNADIIEPPTDMPYGQCRMLLRDADGTVLDISAPTAAVV